MIALLGKKIGMTQIFREDGSLVPVTVIEAGPCPVISTKGVNTAGKRSVQVCFEEVKPSRMTKPVLGTFKKANIVPHRIIREFKMGSQENYEPGQILKADMFANGEYVDVTGNSIGKGFQGGMKRWHWRGGPKTHGSTSHRRPGSIGSSSDPSRVFKGHHLPGHMGNRQITVQNLEVIKVDSQNNLLMLKGAVPGHDNSYLTIRKSIKGKKKVEAVVKPKAQSKAKKEAAPAKAKPAAAPKKK
ncbi:MAG: 50S ribosomal protein L3 [Candidatus Omnitrophica bacterium]|nr:50S ribosomal protein L3 [Candidatus Omnitrophota bacterium]